MDELKEIINGKIGEYKITIGLEVHAELLTKTKAFCSCKNTYGEEPNTFICPICMGLPGALPLFNEEVLKFAIKLGKATKCTIEKKSKHDRKNYFYPDLVKGYQITQDDRPICRNGQITIKDENNEDKIIRIERIHMEEDTAKMLHDAFGRGTLLDFNRSSIPLVEIVSKPDISSEKEAIKYLEKLREILVFLDISACKMEEGGFRADVNVSVSKNEILGNRTEIKNMNSFKSIERAIVYEANRQISLIEKGEKIEQQTMRFDEISGKTFTMRSKENANDYRYFPEADLSVFEIDDEYIEEISKKIPKLPDELRKIYKEKYNLNNKQIEFILSDRIYIEIFENTLKLYNNPIKISNYLMSEIAAYLNENALSAKDISLNILEFAKFIKYIDEEKLNSKMAKIVIVELLKTNKPVDQIIEEKGLVQVNNTEEIENLVEEVLNENESIVQQYIGGSEKVFGFLVGLCMKKTKGKANPKIINEKLKSLLEEKKKQKK